MRRFIDIAAHHRIAAAQPSLDPACVKHHRHPVMKIAECHRKPLWRGWCS
jgi:hypothetical protein